MGNISNAIPDAGTDVDEARAIAGQTPLVERRNAAPEQCSDILHRQQLVKLMAWRTTR